MHYLERERGAGRRRRFGGRRRVAQRVERREDILELYRQHHDGLVRLGVLLGNDPASAEDAVQDAFVKLYGAWDRIRERGAIGSYLRTTVVNIHRGRARRRSLVPWDHSAEERLDDAESAEDGAFASADQAEVTRCLTGLPRRQRECLVLRHYAGLSETEIAHCLEIAVGTVRTHLKRGTATLEADLATWVDAAVTGERATHPAIARHDRPVPSGRIGLRS